MHRKSETITEGKRRTKADEMTLITPVTEVTF
jgi:hypothetical protein